MTAIIAVWIASVLAYRENSELNRKRLHLLALSIRLNVSDVDQLQSIAYPRVAKNVDTWEVYVPEGKSYELRFAVGEVTSAGMPENFESIPIAAGRHRITLRRADLKDEDYRFVVFLDGNTVARQTKSRDWMPNGWRQAYGLTLPAVRSPDEPAILQLAATAYTPRSSHENKTYFNGRRDDSVSKPGFRLWIDQADQTYEPASPYVGFVTDASYKGIGFRDGLRYRSSVGEPYRWTFTRPASQTSDAALTIIPEFFVGDRLVLSEQTKEFNWWHPRDEPYGMNALSWKKDPNKVAYNAFLHATVESADAIQPVVELRWDASRPDDIAIRLPDTFMNRELTRWRLRIVDGASHLWRLLEVGERKLDVRTDFDNNAAPHSPDLLPLKVDPQTDKLHRVAWQTDLNKPLQMLPRARNNANAYRGMRLFQGMPLTFAAEFAATLQPHVEIVRVKKQPDTEGLAIPGGAVIQEIRIELDATLDDWIWLRAASR